MKDKTPKEGRRSVLHKADGGQNSQGKEKKCPFIRSMKDKTP
jgi:hypothetical protein